MLEALVGALITGLIWGVTDPLMKRFGGYPSRENWLSKLLPCLANWRYALTFAVNQTGSAAFLWTLNKSTLSFAVPVTNSLKFFITFVTGQLIGESPVTGSRKSCIGLILILIGILLQMFHHVSQ